MSATEGLPHSEFDFPQPTSLIQRRPSRHIFVGGVQVGGGAPIVVQSMTKTPTVDVAATIRQIHELQEAGCELIRAAVPDMDAAEVLGKIKQEITLPLIADIHFDYRLALRALQEGVDGLRINPGNIGGRKKLEKVVDAARERRVPIRIGVNAGSLERDLVRRYGRSDPRALVESTLRQVGLFEELGFGDIKLSLKASNPLLTIQAYRLIAQRVDYPLHLGITESGPLCSGLIKSAVGMGVLLAEGIGDTLRVSLSAEPIQEVRAAYGILRSLGLRNRGVEVVSCPTCARCQLEVSSLAQRVEENLLHVATPLKVAIMGCPVNGPGEAKEADIGIAGSLEMGVLFKKGRVVRKVRREELYSALMTEIERFL